MGVQNSGQVWLQVVGSAHPQTCSRICGSQKGWAPWHVFEEEPVRMMSLSRGPLLTEGSAGPQLSHVIVEFVCSGI